MTSLTVAGSLILGSQTADAAAYPVEKEKSTRGETKHVDQNVSVQQSPIKRQFHVASGGIRVKVDTKAQFVGVGVYKVKRGDTLGRIAASHGLTLKSILKLNPGIKNPSLIYPGQKIRITEGTSSSPSEPNEKPSSPSAGWSKKANAVLGDAKSHLGDPYRYGAAGPGSFDCSGFTRHVFKKNGYSLPRSSSAQATAGVSVSRNNLREGDLVFFRTGSGGGISHVAIYMGDDKIIHATNPRDDVCINRLSESYWSQRYASARRVIR
ncbi:C40 family peptidase [Salinithrix halophila]|uniref:C40 family peptidase n=2 Tax=Salinithrix halophila TaxID=1485204 RepID=A0ABV8JEW2_9BACL